MNDCCYKNLEKPEYVSRATWKCPVCKGDVSLAFILLQQALEREENDE